jgi:hypothetical protein
MVDPLNGQILGEDHHEIGDAVKQGLDLLAFFFQLQVGALQLFDLLL